MFVLSWFFSKIGKLFGGLSRATDVIAIVIIFLVALWIGSDVLARALFKHPLPGTMELVKSSLPAVAFLTFTYTLRVGRHVRIAIVLERLPPRVRETLDVIGSFVSAGIFALITVYVWSGAWVVFQRGDFEGTELRVPLAPMHFAVALACTMLSIQYVVNMFTAIKRFQQS